ncbi:uncharacterized protein LOC120088598 isoform X4 [Benincasa hispida]|uniref:uncharacterized protein LOC120088598 isoform X4 n=1 Tax=Benincasa hispida TaxID=102211 RepID=UPI0019001DC6|nr:uncharacterized protein LOC120088598 isoform X4 [Benincasa hispida]
MFDSERLVSFLFSSLENAELLQDYVQSLTEERVVDERFSQILTKFEEPDCIQLIKIYLKDVESILSELSITIIGAEHMKLAAIHLIQACDQGDQKIVSQALSWMKHEFTITENKFQPVLQMEQRILRVMSKQK